jgi:hypothetical protein
LIDDLSKAKFDADNFEDAYRERILKIAIQKAAGKEIEVSTAAKEVPTVDLMSALKRSLEAPERKGDPEDKTGLVQQYDRRDAEQRLRVALQGHPGLLGSEVRHAARRVRLRGIAKHHTPAFIRHRRLCGTRLTDPFRVTSSSSPWNAMAPI